MKGPITRTALLFVREWSVYSQSVFVKQVFAHVPIGLAGGEARQAAQIVAQFLDGIVAVGQKLALQEVAQLERKVITRSVKSLNAF